MQGINQRNAAGKNFIALFRKHTTTAGLISSLLMGSQSDKISKNRMLSRNLQGGDMKLVTATAVFLLLGLCPAAWCLDAAQLRSLSSAELMQQVRMQRCTDKELDALLPDLQRRFPLFDDRVKALAQLYLGAPYVVDPLTNEAADWFPYGATNCTMYILYIEALANSRCTAEAREHMRLLHYRGGKVGFTERYHFTEDRISDPANTYFAEITDAYVRDPHSLRRIALELNRKKDGSLLFGDRLGRWTKKVALSYIPRTGFTPQLLAPFPQVLGIAFVKKANWDQGLIVGHEGLLIEGDLYHSSVKRGVIMEKNYLKAGFPVSQWDGIILFQLVPQKPAENTGICG